jgi:serine/threonine-protein kinase
MIGQSFGPYRIEDRLGEGGMGIVYKAIDTRLGRPVAIKVLSARTVSDPERKKRFLQEARTASALNHPNILHIYDIGEANGMEFIAMEFVAGKNLDEMLAGKGLPASDVVKYGRQIADALGRAHEAGIIHRDVKPANVMVTADGLVKVLDFGLAKLAEPAEDLRDIALTRTFGPQTKVGTIVGTIAYMSPEQAEGKPVDARSDIFSFGILLYEMVTGYLPFQGDSPVGILSAILSKEPKPLSDLPHVSAPGLNPIIIRCLRKEPEKRFQSMAEVEAALEELEEMLRTPSKPQPAPRRRAIPLPKWDWKRVGVAALVVSLAVLATPTIWRMVRERVLSGGPRRDLIAVLPFECVGSTDRSFCDGVSTLLAQRLFRLNRSQLPGRVLPPEDVRDDAARGPAEARKRLGADMVLTGRIERSGDSVQWTMKTVDTGTMREVSGSERKSSLSAPARLEESLTQTAAKLLGLSVTSGGERGQTGKAGAYDLYLQGLGTLARQTGDEDHATSLFRQALAQDPIFAAAKLGLAESEWVKKDSEAARRDAGDALAAGADGGAAYLLLGEIEAGSGDRLQEAIEEFRRSLEANPLGVSTRAKLAETYEAAGQLQDAESTYKNLIGLWPRYLAPYSHLAAFYARQGRYQDAEPMFRKVIEMAPESPSGYQNLGALYHLEGRWDDAAAMMKKALAIKPTALGYTNLGTLYFFQGHYSDAVPLMEKAVEMDPAEYRYWGNLGDAYRWTPDYKSKAAGAYKKAIELARQTGNNGAGDADLHATLAGYCAKLPNVTKALAEIAQARRLAPMNPRVLFQSALVYEISGKREQAIGALELSLQAGYSIDEIRTEPELTALRKDPRYLRLDKAKR